MPFMRMAITQSNKQVNKIAMSWRGWGIWNPGALLVAMGSGAATGQAVQSFPPKLNIEFPHDPATPATPCLRVDPVCLKAEPGADICTPLFTAVTVTTAPTWKQCKGLAKDKRRHAMWSIHRVNLILSYTRKETDTCYNTTTSKR